VALTVEEIENMVDMCKESQYDVIHFTDVYLDIDVVEEGLRCILAKIRNTAMGLSTLNAADRLLLMLIDGQRETHF